MFALLESPRETAPEMSVVGRNFDSKEEVTMTATATHNAFSTSRRPRPHGLDRLVMRLSLTMLLWARRHADRIGVTAEQHARAVDAAAALQRREHDSALRAARVR